MKNKFIFHFALLAASFLLAACSDNEPFETITPEDQPCILDPIFPDRTAGGELAVYQSFSRDKNLTIDMIVTPSKYTTVTWLLDGEPVQTGATIDMNLLAGTYVLRVEAATAYGKSTYRECWSSSPRWMATPGRKRADWSAMWLRGSGAVSRG